MAHEIQAVESTGRTLTARVLNGATVVVSSITLTEQASAGYYTNASDITGLAAGVYQLLLMEGSVVLDARRFRWNGTAEIAEAGPGDAMALTSGERSTLAAVIEAALLADGDGQAFVNAIVAAIGNTNVDQAVLIAAIRADIERAGGMLSTKATLAAIEGSTVLAKETSVTARPTLSAIEASTVLAKEATSAAVKAKTDALPAAPAAVSDIPSPAAIAAAVWAAGSRTLTSVGTLVADTAAAVWASVVRTLTADPGAAAHATTQSAVASLAAANLVEHDATQAAISGIQLGGGASVSALLGADTSGYATGSVAAALEKLNQSVPEGSPAVVVPGAPADTALCRVYGYLETITNEKVLANVKVEITLQTPTGVAASERLIAHRTITLTTDAQGRLVGPTGDPWVDLQRNDLMQPAGTSYLISSTALGVRGKPVTLTTQVADLRTLLLA